MNAVSILPPAVIMGLSATGLYAIRELGAAGIPVIGMDSKRQCAAASKYLQHVIIEPDRPRCLEVLRKLVSGCVGKPVLIPTSDQDLEFIINNCDKLAGEFAFQASYADGNAANILNKSRFYRLCDKHDVIYPALHEVTLDGLGALKHSLSYPVIIKPSRIHDLKTEMAGKKGWIVRHEDQFARVVKSIPGHAGTLLAQEVVPGPESEISLFTGYFDQQGRVHQPFTCRKLRQFPPGFGSASLVISEDEPETRRIAEKFLREIGFRGIAAVELKKDPATGQRKMIEINPRPSLWFSASTAARKSIALAAYCDLTGAMPLPMEQNQQNGVLWRYPMKDSYSALFYRLKRGFVLPPPDVGSAARATKHVFPVSESDDQAPVIAEYMTYLGKGMGRVLYTFRNRTKRDQ